MILKVVRKGSVEVEYYEGVTIEKHAVLTVPPEGEKDTVSIRALVSNSQGLVADIGLQTGDVSYVMEGGKTVDCFQA